MSEKIQFRDKQCGQILDSLRKGINARVFGPVGSGKTAVIRLAIEKFNKQKTGKAVYIDCLFNSTDYLVLHELVESLGLAEQEKLMVVTKSSKEIEKLLRRKTAGTELAVCIDHLEHLREPEVVSKLIALNFTVILVADDFVTFDMLDDGAKSNVVSSIAFPAYTEEQTARIISKVSACRFSKEALAKIAAQCRGNMQLALRIVQMVDNQLRSIVTDEDIPLVDGSIAKNEDEKLLIEILKQRGRVLGSGNLFHLYRDKTSNLGLIPKSDRAFRKIMLSLRTQGLIEAIGERKGRAYRLLV